MVDIFVFLITTIGMAVQMHFPNSSPSDKYSANVWIFIGCLFLYAFSFACYKSHASTSNNINDNPYIELSSPIAVIVALISVLLSKPVIALIIFLYFMCLLIYFAPNPVTDMCQKIGSHAHDVCERTEHNVDPADNMELGI